MLLVAEIIKRRMRNARNWDGCLGRDDCRCILYDTLLLFSADNDDTTVKISVQITGTLANIWRGNIPNKKEKAKVKGKVFLYFN